MLNIHVDVTALPDEKILFIREKISEAISLAEDNFFSANILYESGRYRTSIPLLKDSVLWAIKAVLMLYFDELPKDSLVVDAYYRTVMNEEMRNEIGLNDIFKKLKNLEQDMTDNPFQLKRDSWQDLDYCYREIRAFLVMTNKHIKKSLLTTSELTKRKLFKAITQAIFFAILAAFVTAYAVHFIHKDDFGLRGRYFSDPNFENLIASRVDKKINFYWGQESIINNHADYVYIRWIGKIKTPKSGVYAFKTRSDDGARLWIDDNLLIDNWYPHSAEDERSVIELEQGYHDLKVEYFERKGYACVKLLWLIPGTNMLEVIPSSCFKRVKRLVKDSIQDESNIPVGEIIKGMEIGQTFYCHYDNLTQIKVMLATYRRKNHQEVVFHLKKSPNARKDVYTETFNASDVVDNNYRTFTFPPIHDSKGKTFYFCFESPRSKRGDAITLWSNSVNKYKGGCLCRNGKRSKGDLRFLTYSYEK